MPDEMIIPANPVRFAGWNIYPLIRTSSFSWSSGCFLFATPLALFIEENGAWFFVPLEEGITEDSIQSVITGQQNDQDHMNF